MLETGNWLMVLIRVWSVAGRKRKMRERGMFRSMYICMYITYIHIYVMEKVEPLLLQTQIRSLRLNLG